MSKYLIYFGDNNKTSTMYYEGLLAEAIEYVNNDLFYYPITNIIDNETGEVLSTKTDKLWKHTFNSVTYAIADNEGNIYAHDIKFINYAKMLLCDIIADLSKRISAEMINELGFEILEDLR